MAFLTLCVSAYGQDGYRILLTGASFATPNNGWFEFGCEAVGAEPVNRAVSAESIVDTAQKMHDGTLYAKDDLETVEALVIMHVHDRDVYHRAGGEPFPDEWERYGFPMDRNAYAEAYDYVIKRYMSDCYDLRFEPGSRYYGLPYGKPAIIVLCTHWHDGRPSFNGSVRELAAKWGLPLVEFDRWIGFSGNVPHPRTGEQASLLHAGDRQQNGGQVYGFHPYNGDVYIQKKMAAIFADVLRRVLPLR